MGYGETSSQELYFLYQMAQVLASTIDLAEVSEYVVDGTCALLGAEQGFVYFLDSDGVLRPHLARGLAEQELRQLAEACRPALEERRPLVVPHPSSDAGAVLAVPLVSHDQVHGLIGVATVYERHWEPYEEERIGAVANLAALALENARLYARVQKELAMGRRIQQSFLPEVCPLVQDCDVAAISRPALQVGGDFYDLFPLPQGRLGLVVADVSEKGVPAALFMALTRSLMRVYGRDGATPAEVVRQVNDFLCTESGSSTMFVTLFYGIWDPAQGRLHYVNAGHNPPYIRRREGAVEQFPLQGGLPLGVLAGQRWSEGEAPLRPGDILLAYSDGLTEAMNERRECFGQDRLEAFLRHPLPLEAEEALRQIVEQVDAFAAGHPQADDLTVLVLCYHCQGEGR